MDHIVGSAFASSPGWSHNNQADDCRASGENGQQPTGSPYYYATDVVNLAEIEYNEGPRGPGTPWGAVDAVGWTIRDRAYIRACGTFVGGVGNRSNCSTLSPNDPTAPLDSVYYCCVEHGNTTVWGTVQQQFNDAHQSLNTLYTSGYIAAAYYLYNGYLPDMSVSTGTGTYYEPPSQNNSACTYNCSAPICGVVSRIVNGDPQAQVGCQNGVDCTAGGSPFGPLEFNSQPIGYVASYPQCEHEPYDPNWGWGNVCSGGNYFASNQIGTTSHPLMFAGEVSVGNGFYYLVFSDSDLFGYYDYVYWPWLFHVDMGFEYFQNANDPLNGAYLYDPTLNTWFYTAPSDFPFLYNFTPNDWWYYFPVTPANEHYTSNPRVFEDMTTHQIYYSSAAASQPASSPSPAP